jgi:hypothetical protein
MTDNTERDALAQKLEREFGSFLAHWPSDPDRFFGGSADSLLAWMRENGYEKRGLCPQPCEHLSQQDAREGRTCAEHPCTCANPKPVEHDPRCISLTTSEFRDTCDCKILRMIDSHAANAKPEPVVVDDAMVERAREAFWAHPDIIGGTPSIRAALLAALTPDGQEKDR